MSCNQPSSRSSSPMLQQNLDSGKVVEMIKSANLYELISMSLKSSGMQNDSVEEFIQRALEKKQKDQQQQIQSKVATQEENLQFDKPRLNRELGILTDEKKNFLRSNSKSSMSPSSRRYQPHNDENSIVSFKPDFENQTFQLQLIPVQQVVSSPFSELPPFQSTSQEVSPQKSEKRQIVRYTEEQNGDDHKLRRTCQEEKKAQQEDNQRIHHVISEQFLNLNSNFQELVHRSPQGEGLEESTVSESATANYNSQFNDERISEQKQQNIKIIEVDQKHQVTLQKVDSKNSSSQKHNFTQNLPTQKSSFAQPTQSSRSKIDQIKNLAEQLRSVSAKKSPSQQRQQSHNKSRNTQVYSNTQQQQVKSSFTVTSLQQTQQFTNPNSSYSPFRPQSTRKTDTTPVGVREKKSALDLVKRSVNESKKVRMQNSLNSLTIGTLIELERIKKPTIIVLQVSRMLCSFVNAFRDKPLEDDLTTWEKMKHHIDFFITKQISEIISNIKSKIFTENQDQREINLTRMQIIKEEFFSGENLKILKHMNSSKSLKTIVHFVFNIMTFILSEAGINDGHCDNVNLLIGQKIHNESDRKSIIDSEQKATRTKSTNKLTSNTNKVTKCKQVIDTYTRASVSPLKKTYSPFRQSQQQQQKQVKHNFVPKQHQLQQQQIDIKRSEKQAYDEEQLMKNVETAQTVASDMFKVDMLVPSDQNSPAKKFDYSLMASDSRLTELIKVKGQIIEENIKQEKSPMEKKIDMSIIEDLKRRRLEQRQQQDSSRSPIGRS